MSSEKDLLDECCIFPISHSNEHRFHILWTYHGAEKKDDFGLIVSL